MSPMRILQSFAPVLLMVAASGTRNLGDRAVKVGSKLMPFAEYTSANGRVSRLYVTNLVGRLASSFHLRRGDGLYFFSQVILARVAVINLIVWILEGARYA